MFRVALIGAGGMAKMHAACYGRLPNAELVAVCDKRSHVAQALASHHGASAYVDAEEMLRSSSPDVIDVCVPTPWHADYVVQAAAASPRGIVVEKPMGRTVADCERMIAACGSANVPLFVAHVLRFFPEFAAAKQQVGGGAIGDAVAVRTRRGGGFPRAWENWYADPVLSGGLILDLIIHDFDWLRWTFGDVDRVYAKGMLASGATVSGDIDYALVTLRFKSGVVGHVEGTWADPGGFKVSFEIAGDAGLLEYNFNQPSSPPFVASVAREDGAGPGVAVPESPLAVNPYEAELAHFLDCLERGTTPAVTPQDGLEAVRIALAAIESAATGKPVAL